MLNETPNPKHQITNKLQLTKFKIPGEIDLNICAHPHPSPFPSKGRELRSIFMVRACLPVGRGDEPAT
jgi:hypothetical protein